MESPNPEEERKILEVYKEVGSYKETSTRTGWDWRTIKRIVTRSPLVRNLTLAVEKPYATVTSAREPEFMKLQRWIAKELVSVIETEEVSNVIRRTFKQHLQIFAQRSWTEEETREIISDMMGAVALTNDPKFERVLDTAT